MGKIVDCAKVDPSTGCSHVVRGETEEELMKNAAEHAKEHGIVEATPELMERVRANIEEGLAPALPYSRPSSRMPPRR